MGQILDIRDKIMARIVEENAVQFIPIGDSGNNYVITLSKNALIAIREGKSFPIELLAGDKKKTFVIMRDTSFKAKMHLHNKIANQAKESVQSRIEIERETQKTIEGLDFNN